MIYIDPPFSTNQVFRGTKDQKAYQYKIAGADFLESLRKRLVILRELLAEDGSIFVHIDWKKGHYVKVLMDEIFKENNFRNEIIWHYRRWSASPQFFQRMHDTLLWYSRSGNYIFNPVLQPYANPEWIEDTVRGVVDGKLVRLKDAKGNYIKRNKKNDGVLAHDVWEDINFIAPTAAERIDFPTQKPEKLLERIIKAASNEGDVVLDVFAGSGTTPAVAEKLNRRWIAIDIEKLAIYTIQKRMLNLRTDISNTGEEFKQKPFTLYNAGLYDFDTLRILPWESWRFFALQLFECKDESHKIHGFQMDGKRQGSSVHVFNHFDKGTVSRETIADLHSSIGKAVGEKCYIIAPRGAFLFQEDYIEMDGVRYYALRIPYSYINEIHRKKFIALTQPRDEVAINQIIEAVGFDFIQPPTVEYKLTDKKGFVVVDIKKFESRARLRGEEKVSKHDALSMVMVDYDYNGKVFDLDKVFYANAIKDNKWKIELSAKEIKGDVMLVFLDIYGNESRIVIAPKARRAKAKK